MLKRLAAFLAGCLLACSGVAHAQMMGVSGGPFASSSTYSGPGDQQAFTAWWSCTRGYNGAYATGSNNACQLRRASDNTTQNIVILSNGNFDVASANTFAGTDATCTGTISSTTLTCASASSTPHAGSTLTGAGITQPSYIVSCGTFTGGAGTCTLNAAQTVSVGETITMQYGLYVAEAYDETGNGWHLLQATAGSQPQWLPNCGNSLPCIQLTSSSITLVSSGNFTPASGTVSMEVVGARATGTGTTRYLEENGAASNRISGGNGLANTVAAGNSATITATAADGTAHAFTAVLNSSGVLAVDGTETTGGAAGTTSAGTIIIVGATSSTLNESEAGFTDNVVYSGTIRTNLCHSGRVYYGTSGSC